MNLIRSLIFAVMQTGLTIFFSVVALFSFPFSAHTRYRMITGYNHIVIWLARVVLGIRYVVRGRENLPARPAVVLAKHQSAWGNRRVFVPVPAGVGGDQAGVAESAVLRLGLPHALADRHRPQRRARGAEADRDEGQSQA